MCTTVNQLHTGYPESPILLKQVTQREIETQRAQEVGRSPSSTKLLFFFSPQTNSEITSIQHATCCQQYCNASAD